MYCVKQIKEDLFYIGSSDRRLALFENVFPIPEGVSYNSYFIDDEKTVVLDTVDKAVASVFFENLEHVLKGRKLDYLIVNHMEPDHCATIGELVDRNPDVKLVGNQKTLAMIKQFFNFEISDNFVSVCEGDTLNIGKHCLTFAMAPMVHWPEVMVTYDSHDKVLFSADAFGTFGALSGNIFASEKNYEAKYLNEARRYYSNIVGKYGPQTLALLKKAACLDIQTICPLHGPVWNKNIGWFIEKYQRWGSYTPEDNAVMIAYASVYGNTENAANILATALSDLGVQDIVLYDVSATHPSVIVSEAFRCSHLVFAAITYNAGIFCNMETALVDLLQHNLQNRTVAFIENGSWAPMSGKLMKAIFEKMKNINFIEETVSIKSALKAEQMASIKAMAKAIYQSMSRC